MISSRSPKTRNPFLPLALFALLAFFAIPAASSSATSFTGDFETGNLSQWAYAQAIPGRITVVKSPVAKGTYAGRFEVKAGDEDPDTKSQRAELFSPGEYKSGDIRYFHIRSRISSWDYSHWGMIWQVTDSGAGTPPLTLQLFKSGSTPMLWLGTGSGSTEYWSAPLPGSEKWFEVTIRVNFGSEGSLQVWLDGEPQTMANGKSSYEKANTLGVSPASDRIGLYRSKESTGTAVVYHDDYRVTESLGSFTGDFETGNLSQFVYTQAIPGRATVVKSPVAQGTYAGRFEVKEGDEEPDTHSQRAEVVPGGLFYEGDVRYFHIRARVSSWDYTHWGLIWQLHDESAGSPPVCLEIYKEGSTPYLSLQNGAGSPVYWQAALPGGSETWFELVVRVAFGKEGSIKAWLNGTPQTLANGKTIYEGVNTLGTAPDFDKLGIYRSKEAIGTAVIYHDDYRVTEVFP